jgi:hypothetical protein
MGYRSRWQDGRRAWQRLNGWHQRDPRAIPGHGTTGEAALIALEDIHLVRTLLDTAELNAVHTARAGDCSWAQIAVALHMTRQAAWEKWHDLETPAAMVTTTPHPPAT